MDLGVQFVCDHHHQVDQLFGAPEKYRNQKKDYMQKYHIKEGYQARVQFENIKDM